MGKRSVRCGLKRVDPYYEREAAKYKHPIPSREYILQKLDILAGPKSFNDLLRLLRLKGTEQEEALRRRVCAMVRDGQLLIDRRGRYALVDKLNLVSGIVEAHRDGYGFLVPDDHSADIFLNPRQMRLLLPHDRVLVSIISRPSQGRREGAVVEILERGFREVVGKFSVMSGANFITPLSEKFNQGIVVPQGSEGKAHAGDYVVVEITAYPTVRSGVTAKVKTILGRKLSTKLMMELALREYGVPFVWPNAVIREGRKLLNQSVSYRELEGRHDLRSLPFVTIDGDDAKDFDDAVYAEKKDNTHWILYVAIADVSHYVTPHTALDEEALKRGNSVYFPGKVIPMLPEILSNELCSLRPKVDRLVMVCEANLNYVGKITGYRFYPAVICSKARLTYDEVYAALEHPRKSKLKQLPYLQNLYSLYLLLRAQRDQRGALNFVNDEIIINLDNKGKVKEVKPAFAHYVHEMIEECMLVANVCAAKFLKKANFQLLYRVNGGPDIEKVVNLEEFLKAMEIKVRPCKKVTSKYYAEILAQAKGSKYETIVQTTLLRSLKQAIYTTENTGHFGLAYKEYTHFTSPIRRYADILIHRAIKAVLDGIRPTAFEYTDEKLVKIGRHCSLTERRADEASRKIEKWCECLYLKDHLGAEFCGKITSVMNYGFMVRLNLSGIEGLVHVTSLKRDYYRYQQIQQRLIGKRTKKCYALGDKIKVCVSNVNLEEREINFELKK